MATLEELTAHIDLVNSKMDAVIAFVAELKAKGAASAEDLDMLDAKLSGIQLKEEEILAQDETP